MKMMVGINFEIRKNNFHLKQGTMLPSNPRPNPKDLQESLGIDQIYFKPEELAKKKHDFTGYLKDLEERYKDHNFKINDKIFEYWKKKELEKS